MPRHVEHGSPCHTARNSAAHNVVQCSYRSMIVLDHTFRNAVLDNNAAPDLIAPLLAACTQSALLSGQPTVEEKPRYR